MKDIKKIQEFFSQPLDETKKEMVKENNSIDYNKLVSLIKSANNPQNLPIYYNSDQGVVNIGGTGYDKGELVKIFNSKPGQSLDIKTLFYKADQSPEETKNAIESINPSIKVEIGKGYGNKPFVKYIKSMNEVKEKDAVDTITMDIPLFLRMLEYAREDAQEDMDLHDVTEKANLLGKERGILQMEDYNEIVGAAENIKEGLGNEVGDKVYFRGDIGEKYPSSQGYYGIIEDAAPARNYNMMAIYQVTVYDKNDNEIRTIETDWTNLTSKIVKEDTPIQEMIKSVLNGKMLKRKK
jgi:hypothetical protein